ncbi:DUF1566 domain-containing protein [Bacteroides sp. 51]|uniref:Lcl C-terminal domain-containing protein n=1 Tax=Bacteroides sp. 51 TaxID=2302938 RepID=UPI0013D6830E|nr:DUF1566 domain-containing protein [Bacteroides sp. 51]NDV84936.1 DUF1566 domain-containing protein [Bacteroides sp. 51]
MRRFLIIALFAELMVTSGLMAQKVYKSDGTKYILDLTVAAGMPAKSVTNTSKTAAYASFLPSVTEFGMVAGAKNDENHPINATVFQKLEVAPNDMDASYDMDGTGTTLAWVAAFNGCRNSTYKGGNWRLPTQRELMLMYIFYPALKSLGIGGFKSNNYWSATEGTAGYSWYVSFYNNDYENGLTNIVEKTTQYYVRCVREVTD